MRLLRSSSSSSKEQFNGEKNRSLLYLNVYDLTPVNNYLYWAGLGVFHSGIEGDPLSISNPSHGTAKTLPKALGFFATHFESFSGSSVLSPVHGLEYGYGAHEYPSSGIFEVEPRSCPGFTFRRSVLLGSTDMSRSEVRSYMEHISGKYHGDSYHLIAKNCNHFADEVCSHLTGKPIPGWVNRLARVGSFCNCILPESIQVTRIRHLPDHQAFSEDGTDSDGSSVSVDSEEEDSDHQLLTVQNSDMAFLNEKPVRLAKELL
ncbi:hypothetical protein MTR67_036924 [Solanum verrucosum]|uniref:PPPDE domain-containing protein n=1 Tax=Solanum verrucosum TaxID=315347 RepID=A0AAF0UCY5_SOLVR|nr:hypothetical protein MTR67_036924 [Solanum verrucosum]